METVSAQNPQREATTSAKDRLEPVINARNQKQSVLVISLVHRGLPPKIAKNTARDRNSMYDHPNDNARYTSIILNPLHRQEPRQIFPKLGPNGEFLHSTMVNLNGTFFQGNQQRFSTPTFTFGDLPMANYQSGMIALPNSDVGAKLIAAYFNERVFWAAFALDKYLSYALNDRPQRIDLDSTDQDMPKFLNDRNLTSTFLMPVPRDTLSHNFASNLQMELAIIISKILKDVYGVRRPTVKAHLALANGYMIDLSAWNEKASLLIRADLDTLNGSELYKLQRSELLLAYRHAYILLLRNFTIDGTYVYSSAGVEDEETISNEELESEIDEFCGKLVEACLYICEIIEVSEQETEKDKIELTQSLGFRSAWFTHYIMYSAAVVIYINGLRHVDRVATQTDCMILKKSLKLHQPLRDVSHPGTFVGQYVSVLDELKEALAVAMDQYQVEDRRARGGAADSSGSEDDENMVITISSDDGSEGVGGPGIRGEDTQTMGSQRANRGGASRGRIPIMERINRWGFARLIGQ
ncbi:hypothetical protein DID88_010465 [Monilinia fructigena]|uniref:Transcription factor domain-containing protein n=1 Tax=Monilinia fructigena TaxID=38457 RepID=A0A395ILV2_9HELO|nr:hypothetical protein DID88_010465 [Monilinia fructigena]